MTAQKDECKINAVFQLKSRGTVVVAELMDGVVVRVGDFLESDEGEVIFRVRGIDIHKSPRGEYGLAVVAEAGNRDIQAGDVFSVRPAAV